MTQTRFDPLEDQTFANQENDEPLQGITQLKSVSKPTPLFAQVASQLIRAIRAGEFAVGSRLPGEQELAKIFGVSRPSVREALSCLQFEGYLEPRQGSGTVVISSVERGSQSSETSKLGRVVTDAFDIMEARLEIEPTVIGLAAADPVPSELKRVKRILAGMELALSEPEMQAHSDLVVHTTLIRVCKNKVLVDIAEHLLGMGGDTVFQKARDHAWVNETLLKDWYIHHQTMAQGIMERDPEKAQNACKEHIVSVLKNMRYTQDLSKPTSHKLERLIGKHDTI